MKFFRKRRAICNMKVSSEEPLFRFGEYFCSEEHADDYMESLKKGKLREFQNSMALQVFWSCLQLSRLGQNLLSASLLNQRDMNNTSNLKMADLHENSNAIFSRSYQMGSFTRFVFLGVEPKPRPSAQDGRHQGMHAIDHWPEC